MLPQPNSNDTRIRRCKSANSVKERRKHPLASTPIDPNSARVHAMIAAHRAMDRSRASTSDDLTRSDSSASKQSTGSQQRLNNNRISFTTVLPPQRQQPPLQTTMTPSLVTSLSVTSAQDFPRDGPPAYVQTTFIPEAGQSAQGEPSSFRRLRKSRSLLHPRRG